jgi:nucleotide-binding universal stress UspA family protein
MKLDSILVPLDGSALAEVALSTAVDLASRDSTLVLVRSTEAHTGLGDDMVEAQVKAVREAEEYLEAVAGRTRKAGSAKVETHVWYGPPAASIIEAARVMKVNLIVMSTHGRGGLGRLILGSVAESVLRGTRTPILLLRPSEAPVADAGGEARPAKEAIR